MKVVLVWFMLVNGSPVTPSYEWPTADALNCQLDVDGISGMSQFGETLNPPITFMAACEVKK